MKMVACLIIAVSSLMTIVSLISAEPAMPDSIVRVGACATPGTAWGVFVQGDYASVADRGYLTEVDISLPSAPWVVSSFADIHVHPKGVFLVDTIAFLNNGLFATFTTVNVSDPAAPYKLGWCFRWNPSIEPKGIHVLDTVAYLANANYGLYLINVAAPSAPSVIDSLDTPGISIDLYAQDTLVYIADLGSLHIVNVAIPTGVLQVGAVAMPNSCYDVFVVDTLAYVCCQSSSGTNGSLQIVDVSDPESPSILGSVTMSGDPFAIYVSGKYAYVVATDWWASSKGRRTVGGLRPAWAEGMSADIEGGLRIVDVSVPASPLLTISYDTPGDPRDVFVQGDLVFVADYDSLQILRHIPVGIAEEESRAQNGSSPLAQNQPNPFRDATAIAFSLVKPDWISLEIYDVTGKPVRTLLVGELIAGSHSVRWDGRDRFGGEARSGIYFYRLTTGSTSITEKMTLIR